jgi:Uma2 family endonuclease
MSEAHAFPSDALAPWAEVVTGVGPMTVDELAMLPDDRRAHELVEGVLVRMPPSGFKASNIAALLLIAMGSLVGRHGLGRVTGEQGGYVLDPARPRQTELAPDVAFVRAERVPVRSSPDYARAFLGAPDLAVEVASPKQSRTAMASKARRYLDAGTLLVWIVWPRRQQIDVWHPHDTQPSATLAVGDTLSGEDVVPGFAHPVAALFR